MKLSVIIPAHNEANRISQTLKETDHYLSQQGYGYEIIVVDNNSTDDTKATVEGLIAGGLNNVRIMEIAVAGKGATVKVGMEAATGDYAMFMDADNATPISEVEKFWPYFEQGYSVVIGSRYLKDSQVTKKQPIYRIILSRVGNVLIRFLALPGIKDTQLGFKAFTKAAARDIFGYVTIPRYGFDMEVLTVGRLHNFSIKEVPVLWREFGGSHVPLTAYVESLIDLFKIKWRTITGRYKKRSSGSVEVEVS